MISKADLHFEETKFFKNDDTAPRDQQDVNASVALLYRAVPVNLRSEKLMYRTTTFITFVSAVFFGKYALLGEMYRVMFTGSVFAMMAASRIQMSKSNKEKISEIYLSKDLETVYMKIYNTENIEAVKVTDFIGFQNVLYDTQGLHLIKMYFPVVFRRDWKSMLTDEGLARMAKMHADLKAKNPENADQFIE